MTENMQDPKNPHIRTFTGRKFHFLNFTADDICFDDIAHHLSQTCRYVGACKRFYSVAQHSLEVSRRGSNWVAQMWGLFHDAAETYIGDMSSPWKSLLLMQDHTKMVQGFYGMNPDLCPIKRYEETILKAVAEKFNLPWPMPEEVRKNDKDLFKFEMKRLWDKYPLTGVGPEDIERHFMYMYCDLEKVRPKIL